MSTPGVITGKNLVIASVQTNPEVIPNFQELTTNPETRPNGGDLVAGDLWWNPEEEYLYVWTSNKWAVVNAIPNLRVNTDAIDLVDEAEGTQQGLNKTLQESITTETARALEKESELSGLINTTNQNLEEETTRAETEEQRLAQLIADQNALLGLYSQQLVSLERRVAVLEGVGN